MFLSRHSPQIGRRPPRRSEDVGCSGIPVQPVRGEGDRHGLRLPQEGPQHQPLLGREVREAVDIDIHATGIAAFLQTLGQPCDAVPRVGRRPRGKRLIGAKNQPQIPELFPLPTLHRLARPGQVVRKDLILLAFVQRGQQSCEESRFPGGTGIDGQAAGN